MEQIHDIIKTLVVVIFTTRIILFAIIHLIRLVTSAIALAISLDKLIKILRKWKNRKKLWMSRMTPFN